MCDGYVTFAFVRLGIATLRIRRVERCPGKRSKLEEGAPHRIEWREYIRLNLICMHTMAGAPVRARFGGVGWVARMWWLHWTRRSSLRPRRCLGRDSMYSHMCGCRIKRQRWLSQSASSSRIQNRGPSSEERKGEGGGATTTTTTIGDTGDCFLLPFAALHWQKLMAIK